MHESKPRDELDESDRSLDRSSRFRRNAGRLFGALLVVQAMLLTALGGGKPMSPVFWSGVVSVLVLGVGTWSVGRAGKVLRGLAIGALSVGLVGVLVASGDDEHAFLRELRLPDGHPLPRWTSLIPERDAALVGTGFMASPQERDGLDEALAEIYDEMEADVSFRRATQIRTLIGGQTRLASDALVHREPESTKWLVFLHGAGGNVGGGCWVIAHAAARAGWNTICPSTEIGGRWGQGEGPAIFEQALRFARSHGATRIVLAGYSNGAVGAFELLSRGPPADITGLVMISGFDPTTAPTAVRVPTLIVLGADDDRFPEQYLRPWATDRDAWEIEIVHGADHMLLVKARRRLNERLASFLAAR